MRWLVVIVIACGCDSGKPAPAKQTPPPPPTERECGLLLEHMVDLEFAAAGAGKNVADSKAAVVNAKRDEFVVACRKMTHERVACAMAAGTVEAIASCDRMQPPN